MVKRIVVLVTAIVCCAAVGFSQVLDRLGGIQPLVTPYPIDPGVRLLIECHFDSVASKEFNEEVIYQIMKEGVAQSGWIIDDASSYVVALEVYHSLTPAGHIWHILSNSGMDAVSASELTGSTVSDPGFEKTLINPNPYLALVTGEIRNLDDKSARKLYWKLHHALQPTMPFGDDF